MTAGLFTRRFYAVAASRGSIAQAFTAGVDAIRLHQVGQLRPYTDPVFWGAFTVFAGPTLGFPAGHAMRRPAGDDLFWGGDVET